MNSYSFLVVVESELFTRNLAQPLAACGGRATQCSTASVAVDALRRDAQWSALFVDLRLPDGSGLDVLAAFRRACPVGPALVCSANALETSEINRAYDLGADLIAAPFEASRVRRFLETRVFGSASLSRRELAVVDGLLHGQVTKAIAHDLGISSSTVRVLIQRAAAKIGAGSRRELLDRAVSQGLLHAAADVSNRRSELALRGGVPFAQQAGEGRHPFTKT
jgi:DNA-binding NarL/FixJ family response regulator